MQNSASGVQVVRKPSESSAGAVRPRPSVDKPSPRPTPPSSSSLHELASRKQRRRSASRSARPNNASPPAPARPDRPTIVVCDNAAEPSAWWPLEGVRRRWKSGGRWQVPCWLTSFVLHLLAIVVLGSLTVPVSKQRTVMAILLRFGGMDSSTEEDSVELITTSSLVSTDDAAPAAALAPSLGSHLPAESEEHVPVAATESPIIRPALGLDNSSGPPIWPQTERRSRASFGPLAAGGGGNTTADGDSVDNDEVVARFIEFDVGRLRGPEGEKARQDFERLGTESLAALIRGLNKSAKMHASCPVMVISQKVGTLLQQNPEPALLRYALDNIGHDVPPHAVHVSYLQQLMNQLRQLDPSYSGLNLPMLLASLKSRDVQGAIQAANVVASQPDKLMEFEKQDVAWALIQLLTHRARDLRAAARTALVSLAEGKDCGPTDDRREADRIAAACKWSLELCPDRFEATAASLLKTAQKLADAGKAEAAGRNLRKLVTEYTGTLAGKEAAERLQTAEFAFK